MRTGLLFLSVTVFLGWLGVEGRGDDKLPTRPRDSNAERDDQAPAVGGVRTGWTAARVIGLHGNPNKVSRQILFRRHVEQWTYNEPIGLRIELQGVRGQEAQVVSVHPLRSKKP